MENNEFKLPVNNPRLAAVAGWLYDRFFRRLGELFDAFTGFVRGYNE